MHFAISIFFFVWASSRPSLLSLSLFQTVDIESLVSVTTCVGKSPKTMEHVVFKRSLVSARELKFDCKLHRGFVSRLDLNILLFGISICIIHNSVPISWISAISEEQMLVCPIYLLHLTSIDTILMLNLLIDYSCIKRKCKFIFFELRVLFWIKWKSNCLC
jgi:hypothetical protein